ncbi:hypothetical protein JOC85_003504 [Bacillus mesophilus]|uniref:DUF4145 domain-containing protein n=1 Tax=Bacillus mesophilus TaxID=1808955 RepID=A0A6M0QA44_9BACI|nr:DUF4145 domain-containing protein [Bacillus mesophilus]MBM7662694.1 hypothetical protein [Bacillus mesophilus]NEY73244.1 DUF4145 domain-containing protein [Bacillus mesophilus]
MGNSSLFEFVEQFSSELGELATRIEAQLFSQPQAVLIQARLYSEELVRLISKEEGIEEVYPLKAYERIHKLYRQSLIEEDLYMKLEWVRKKGNKAAHDVSESDVMDAIQVHKYLFEMSVWYMQVYVSYDFEAPVYALPTRAGLETEIPSHKIDEIIKPYLEQTLQKYDDMWTEVQEQLALLKADKENAQVTNNLKGLSPKQELKEAAISKERENINRYRIFTKSNFMLTNESLKAAEFEHKLTGEVIYLLRNKELSIMLNPNSIADSFKSEERERHSTALRRFPKKINKGQTPTSYGYLYKFQNEEELLDFLKALS